MTRSVPKLDTCVEVPEYIVRSAWEAIGFEETSGFATVLSAAEEFRAADMTPIFILDKTNMDIYCFAEETWGKKLH